MYTEYIYTYILHICIYILRHSKILSRFHTVFVIMFHSSNNKLHAVTMQPLPLTGHILYSYVIYHIPKHYLISLFPNLYLHLKFYNSFSVIPRRLNFYMPTFR